MSRGSSLIAGVLLIGILSTFAVALQGAGNQIAANQNEAMLAQAKIPAPATNTTDKNVLKPRPGQPGVNQKVTISGKPIVVKIECEQQFACNGKQNKDGCGTYTVKSATEGSADQCKGTPTSPTTQFCLPKELTAKGKGPSCGKVEKCEVGKVIDPKMMKDNYEGLLQKELIDPNITPERQKEIVNNSGLDAGTRSQLAKAFSELDRNHTESVNQQKEAVDDARKQLAALGSECDGGSDRCTAAVNKLATEEAALKKLEEQKARLASAAKELTPTKDSIVCFKAPCPGGETPYAQASAGPAGPGNGKETTGFGKSLGDLGKLLGGGKGGGGGGKSPAPGSGSGAQGQPPQCFDNYSSQTNSSTRSCQCQQGYSIQAGYCQGGNQCPTGYVFNGNGCQPATASSPVATISKCDPTTQDIGEKVKVTFACQNATSAVGLGFDTAGQLSGVAEATIQNPPVGVDRVSYGLTCTSQTGQTTQARQCDVTINKPRIILVTNPKRFDSGKDTTIGWMTVGMERCTLASTNASFAAWNDEQDDYTNVSGSAKTPVLNSDTVFKLTCTTKGGKMKEAQVTADVI